jgi:hypothetical protein
MPVLHDGPRRIEAAIALLLGLRLSCARHDQYCETHSRHRGASV